MAHRPESTNTRTPGPGPKYQLPSRLGETPGHTFAKTKREPVPPPRLVTPVRSRLRVAAIRRTAHVLTPYGLARVPSVRHQGPGAYNLSSDARLEEHSVAAMLRTMEAGRAQTPKARNFYVKEARPGQVCGRPTYCVESTRATLTRVAPCPSRVVAVAGVHAAATQRPQHAWHHAARRWKPWQSVPHALTDANSGHAAPHDARWRGTTVYAWRSPCYMTDLVCSLPTATASRPAAQTVRQVLCRWAWRLARTLRRVARHHHVAPSGVWHICSHFGVQGVRWLL